MNLFELHFRKFFEQSKRPDKFSYQLIYYQVLFILTYSKRAKRHNKLHYHSLLCLCFFSHLIKQTSDSLKVLYAGLALLYKNLSLPTFRNSISFQHPQIIIDISLRFRCKLSYSIQTYIFYPIINSVAISKSFGQQLQNFIQHSISFF